MVMTDKFTPELEAVKRQLLSLGLEEGIAVLHRAKAGGGADLPLLMTPIFEPLSDRDQGRSLSITDDTTDGELDRFLFGHD
jgi:hypothetical protein